MLKEWDYTRKSYIDWLTKTKLRGEFTKNIKFGNLSLWWISELMNKDNRNDKKWYLELHKKLNQKKKISNIKLNYLKLFLHCLKKIISAILSYILIRLFLKNNFKFNSSKREYKDCLYSFIDNFVEYKGAYVDRQYGSISSKKKKEKFYLLEIPQGLILFKNILNYREKLKNTSLDYVIINSQFKIIDIIVVYFKTLILLFKSLKILKKKNFFIIQNKNCRNILQTKLISSYFGPIQDQILKGIAIEKILKLIKPTNFITAQCFYPEARTQFYFARKSGVSNIINVNHAIYSHQNIYWNFNKNDFSKKESSFFSPKPDIFLCKGEKDQTELKKIFKYEKFYNIGCLKTDIRKFLIKKYSNKKKHNKNKIITILAGETDFKSIVKVLNQCDLNSFLIYVEPHPLFKEVTINYFKKNLIHKFTENLNIKKDKLYQMSNFILFGDTQLGTELKIKGYNVIRIYEKEFIPQYELNKNFAYACDKNKLELLLKEKKVIKNKKLLEREYFFRYDFKASERFQKILDKL